MTTTVNIYDAKTHLSRLVDQAAAGEDIVIARAGKPLVRLVPVEQKAPRQPGLLRHLNIDLPDGFFFDPLPEDELKLWG
jgi:prevent-host-death family protein